MMSASQSTSKTLHEGRLLIEAAEDQPRHHGAARRARRHVRLRVCPRPSVGRRHSGHDAGPGVRRKDAQWYDSEAAMRCPRVEQGLDSAPPGRCDQPAVDPGRVGPVTLCVPARKIGDKPFHKLSKKKLIRENESDASRDRSSARILQVADL